MLIKQRLQACRSPCSEDVLIWTGSSEHSKCDKERTLSRVFKQPGGFWKEAAAELLPSTATKMLGFIAASCFRLLRMV